MRQVKLWLFSYVLSLIYMFSVMLSVRTNQLILISKGLFGLGLIAITVLRYVVVISRSVCVC